MPLTGRTQPSWGRSLGAVLAVVLVAIFRDAWAVAVVTIIVTLLVGGYLLHRRARERSVHHRRPHGGRRETVVNSDVSTDRVTGGGLPIVVGVDDSAGSSTAVRWAARYADSAGAQLRLLHALTVGEAVRRTQWMSVCDRAADPQRRARVGDQILGAAAAEVVRERPTVDLSACTAPETPAAALIGASSEASLVVVGSSDRGRWATLFSSVSTRVVAGAGCPVIVVRGDWETSGPVVVAVDGSDSCEPALRFAFLEAARRRCPLIAVHAWQTPPLSARVALRAGKAVATELAQDDVGVSAWRSLNDTVGPWRAAFPGVVVHELLIEGDPETVVTGQTGGAGLVVVGSHGSGPVSGLLLGSTSQHLMHAANCPVAVVRHHNAVRPAAPASVTGPDGSATDQ
jgi:nucleotide-binding universal stress UspA family protein